MGDPRGFLKVKRTGSQCRPVCERVTDYGDVSYMRKDKESEDQASRCMDCGTPFCHWGCPVGNYIPEWNDYMFKGNWKRAFHLLDATNNLPEITGRVCPATCEYACVLGINDDAVTIRENELAVVEYAFKKGLVEPKHPKKRTGKKLAVVGSGPAGLSCAAELNKLGHEVVVFEKDDKIGGILRYGIPDFKLEKGVLDRRIKIWQKEGVRFKIGVCVGVDYNIAELRKEFDAICLAGGSCVPRDLKIEGRGLNGIYFAMDYLVQSNKKNAGEKIPQDGLIDAKGKKVLIIGGGDTGADCVGTAHRQGASCIVQIEILPKPPECRMDKEPWPYYPCILKMSTSHEEGGQRLWSVETVKFVGEDGRVKKVLCKHIGGDDFEIEANLVILAIGFIHPEHSGLLEKLEVEFDKHGNVKTDEGYQTSKKGIFSAGDMRKGQSLVAWAIFEGRESAHSIDKYLSF